jgi:hypothetical protein
MGPSEPREHGAAVDQIDPLRRWQHEVVKPHPPVPTDQLKPEHDVGAGDAMLEGGTAE